MDATPTSRDVGISLSVAMPAYNEEDAISNVIADHNNALQFLSPRLADWEIVCVNDASTDSTASLLATLSSTYPKLRIVHHSTNLGMHTSVRDATHATTGTHVYLTASDGQWPASTLITLFEAMQSQNADVVIGVRRNRSQVYSFWRRFISFCFNGLSRLLLGVKTGDAGGVKLAVREFFTTPTISNSPFAEAERIVIAHHRGWRIAHVPIEFTQRQSGTSTGASFANICSSLRDLFRCTWRYRACKHRH